VLVSTTLVVSAAVAVYFSSRRARRRSRPAAREGGAAALRIESYVQEIEHQLGWMRLPQIGGGTLEQRRIDFLKLLRQVPAITDLSYLDRTGSEQLKVSRLSMDVAAASRIFPRTRSSRPRNPAKPISARCTSARRPSRT